MDEIIEEYNRLTLPDKKIKLNLSRLFEFELRFKKQPRDVFAQVAISLKDKISEKNINLLKEIKISNKEKERQVLVYDPETNEKIENFFQKKQIIKRVEHPHYSVVLSEESKASRFEPTNDSLFRIITRLQFLKDEWAIDLSAVAQIKDDMNQVKNKKEVLFKDVLTVKDFFNIYNNSEILPAHNIVNQYEIEVEYIGKSKLSIKKVDEIAVFLLENFTQEYFQELNVQKEIHKLAELIKPPELAAKFATKLGFKSLGNNAQTLTMDEYMKYWIPTGHYFTIKADGLTTYFTIYPNDAKRACILTSKSVEYIDLSKLKGNYGKTCIVCEKVVTKDTKKEKILAWDIILWKGENVGKLKLEQRLEFLRNAIDELGIENLEIKPIFKIVDLRETIKETIRVRKEVDYPTDGYIMAIDGEDVNATKWYKVKENNTIDFLAIKCPSVMLGKAPHIDKPGKVLYLLFNSINTWELKALGKRLLPQYQVIFGNILNQTTRIPIQFAPSDNPCAYLWYASIGEHKEIEKKVKPGEKLIVELNWDLAKKQWELERIRDDRKKERNYLGNSFINVAEPNWISIHENIKFEELYNPQIGYFASDKNEMYVPQTAFNSYIKSQLVEKYANKADWILDLASGKGQDLQRYMVNNVKSGIFIDIDRFALSRLVKKRFDLMYQKLKQNRSQERVPIYRQYNNMETHIIVQDLSKPYKETLEKINKFRGNNRIDTIFWQFAIHYLCGSPRNIANFTELLTKLAPKEKNKTTRFAFTAFDGKRVFELLRDLKESETWEIFAQQTVLKYKIKKLYSSQMLEKSGQKIAVKLPFSSEELYEEYLVNFDFIIDELKKKGWKLIEYVHFEDKIEEFRKSNERMYDKLDADDKKYLSLYSFACLER